MHSVLCLSAIPFRHRPVYRVRKEVVMGDSFGGPFFTTSKHTKPLWCGGQTNPLCVLDRVKEGERKIKRQREKEIEMRKKRKNKEKKHTPW